MIKLTEKTANALLAHLTNAEKHLSKKSESYHDVKTAKDLVAPIIIKHIHQQKVEKALVHIIDKNFGGDKGKFTMWYINEFHHDDFSHTVLSNVNSAINEFSISAQETLDKLHTPEAQEDQFIQMKLVQKYSTLMNLIHKTRNYSSSMLVIYNAFTKKPFIHLLDSHDVIMIKKYLDKHGSLYNDIKKLHAKASKEN